MLGGGATPPSQKGFLNIVRRRVLLRTGTPIGRLHFLRSYAGALAVAFANPLTVLLFCAAFPALATTTEATLAPVLVTGVFVGAVGWYTILTTSVALLRNRLSIRALQGINAIAGFLLAGLGAWTLASALRAIFALRPVSRNRIPNPGETFYEGAS